MRFRSRGFSLVELVVVVMVLSILAAIAVPQFMMTRGSASVTRAAQDLRAISNATEMHYVTRGSWPPEAAKGRLPQGMEEYLDSTAFSNPCPLGGQYDWVNAGLATRTNTGTTRRTGISINWGTESVPLDLCQRLDAMIDNGDLKTGRIMMPNARTLILVQESAEEVASRPYVSPTD